MKAAIYFKTSEFDCRCGCGRNLISPSFVAKLDRLRAKYGRAMVISSGYRCPDYNARVSSTGSNGPHTTGQAADVLISGERAMELLVLAVYSSDFGGIGVKQHGPHESRFLHLDDLPNAAGCSRPRVWSYP